MAEKPSLKTVARAAEVSPSTVSNAYNRPEQLSTELREKIFEIAGRQGYAGPDPAARSLRSRHVGAIGVLLTQQLSYAFSDPYCAELLAGVAEVAEASGTGMLLMPVPPHDPAHPGDRESVQSVARAVVDGVVADGIDDRHPALRVLTERGVRVARSSDGAPGPQVVVDDRAAARAVGEHLAGLGHRSAAVLVDTVAENELTSYAQLRLEGLREVLDVQVVAAGPNSRANGRRAASTALDGPVTAIAAVTDALALGALDELAARGLEPGTDVSVTGFDDVPEAAAAGLTTVRQPIREKGRAMARLLLDPSAADRVELATELVTRASTGRAPRRPRSNQTPTEGKPFMSAPVRIAVILASVRPERFGPVVGRWFLGRAEARDDMDIDVIDLADFDLPVTLDGGKDAPELLRRIDAADGFVVVTPEYNHGYPGYLKIAIDSAREEWHRKPVAFVSYGGMAGGQRSVEQLRAVFAELQAPTLRETVSFTWCEEQFDQDGELHESERADSGADTLLSALHWWATSLRAARNEVPA